jgi:hypothetical protein
MLNGAACVVVVVVAAWQLHIHEGIGFTIFVSVDLCVGMLTLPELQS